MIPTHFRYNKQLTDACNDMDTIVISDDEEDTESPAEPPNSQTSSQNSIENKEIDTNTANPGTEELSGPDKISAGFISTHETHEEVSSIHHVNNDQILPVCNYVDDGQQPCSSRDLDLLDTIDANHAPPPESLTSVVVEKDDFDILGDAEDIHLYNLFSDDDEFWEGYIPIGRMSDDMDYLDMEYQNAPIVDHLEQTKTFRSPEIVVDVVGISDTDVSNIYSNSCTIPEETTVHCNIYNDLPTTSANEAMVIEVEKDDFDDLADYCDATPPTPPDLPTDVTPTVETDRRVSLPRAAKEGISYDVDDEEEECLPNEFCEY